MQCPRWAHCAGIPGVLRVVCTWYTLKTLRMSLRITELVNCKYTGRSHLECNHHKLIGYRVGTLSMCSQCIHNVPGGCTDPCPQCVLLLSMDGAQLYKSKQSDCWIYVWILVDLGPDKCYKIWNILPGGVIPGPNPLGDLDSFLFPGLAHLSALQHEGLHIWDAYR